ncbi:MAG: Redoxin domain protein [Marmoricola sp.]|jgi:cytochrome c biogenesis protein CcmG/thiol:disulfide interchange protein DsbE|nr:Redoxin domain protein [Marmoricola sp.]
MSRLLAALVAVLLLATGCSAEKKASSPDALPDVTLKSFDNGPSLDLSTLKGPVVVNVWASWCGPCRKELPYYQAFAQKYAGKVKVVGVDFQDTQKGQAQELIRQTGVRYPLYEDPEGAVRVRGLPQVLLVDAHGRVTYRNYVEITSVAQLEKLVGKHLGAIA